jgi:DNA-directed RNA polymerase specialized sigma24 family protein
MRSATGEARTSGLTCSAVVMRNMQLMSSEQPVASLYWLAFLLTGQSERSIDIAVEAVTSAGTSSPRRVVISEALAAVRDEVAASACRTKSRQLRSQAVPAGHRTVDGVATRVQLERAMLGIEVFPRAALLLSVFEGVPVEDAAALLEAPPDLVVKARTLGLADLTAGLARYSARHTSIVV